MYDLMIEPEDEDTAWIREEVEGALQAIGLEVTEEGLIAANAEGTVWVDVGAREGPDVLVIAVRAREDQRAETIRKAMDIAFYLAQRLRGVVVDMQLGGRVLPENREWVEREFLR